MAYNFYQNAAPGWGTAQYQFNAPPQPAFQPQATWGGADYYRAGGAQTPDPPLFESAWNSVRDYRTIPSAAAVGLNQARVWHRRLYGGLPAFTRYLPHNRHSWAHQSTLCSPPHISMRNQS
ncbi:hypothetical protein HGRIS_014089 [Hohenbuehelia grisea]|uniref:Uncharacterized protein n=1 Tax=Hohenbuehelia grisea TaxID=104357 RepID=A0ABR3JSL5_9AGAR